MTAPTTLHRSLELAGTLPALMVAADRVAATVIQGVHGRRRVGQGDAFWQYRPYREGDSASQIDWRQSARSRHLFVRETEWEAAASVWLWRDASPSMQYASLRNTDTKAVRGELLTLALASLLADAGERVAVLGTGMRPTAGSRSPASPRRCTTRRATRRARRPACRRWSRCRRTAPSCWSPTGSTRWRTSRPSSATMRAAACAATSCRASIPARK